MTDKAKKLINFEDIIKDNKENDWQKENIDAIKEAFPSIDKSVIYTIYHFGYVNGFERAQDTLDKTKHLFT